MKTPEQKVADGAALLDRRRPGWRKRVNSRTLDLVHGETCILGQVYGAHFAEVSHKPFPGAHRRDKNRRDKLEAHGFYISPEHYGTGDYEILKTEWLRVIRNDGIWMREQYPDA